MDNTFKKYPFSEKTKRQYEALAPYLQTHKERIIIGAFIVLSILFFLCVHAANRKYTNVEAGYEVTGPQVWQMEVSFDRQSVKYFKTNINKKGKRAISTIKVYHQIGNSFGETSLDFIVNGLVPQARYAYETKQGVSVDLREEPYLVERQGREWATASFYIDHRDLEVIFVTQAGDYVIIVVLDSPEKQQKKNEQVLYKTLDSMKFNK